MIDRLSEFLRFPLPGALVLMLLVLVALGMIAYMHMSDRVDDAREESRKRHTEIMLRKRADAWREYYRLAGHSTKIWETGGVVTRMYGSHGMLEPDGTLTLYCYDVPRWDEGYGKYVIATEVVRTYAADAFERFVVLSGDDN